MLSQKENAASPATVDLSDAYAGRRVLVVGADGFLGVNCVHALAALGAQVSIVSRREHPRAVGFAGTVFRGDLRDSEVIRQAVSGQQIVIDFAGNSGAATSNENPERNLHDECKPKLALFNACATVPNPPTVVFCSSRLVYGVPQYLPVDENHPLSPHSIYAAHKIAAEQYLNVFAKTRGLRHCIVRLSNPYGPNASGSRGYGIINHFIYSAADGRPIVIYGDGRQERDYIYVGDVIAAVLSCAVTDRCIGQTLNLGARKSVSIAGAAATISRLAGGTPVHFIPWPQDAQKIETGDYRTNLEKLDGLVALPPQVSFEEGVARTLKAAGRPPRMVATVTGVPEAGRDVPIPPTLRGRRVLVTGASGFIGSHLVARCCAEGATVAAVARTAGRLQSLSGRSAHQFIECDLRDAQCVRQIVAGFAPDIIFHFAAHPDAGETFSQLEKSLELNLVGTVNLLEAFRIAGGGTFLYGDSCKVYGDCEVPYRESMRPAPNSSYAISKAAGWHACELYRRLHGIASISLRPTLIYGPRQGFNLLTFVIESILDEKPIRLDGGAQTRDPLYIDDAVDAFIRAAQAGPRLAGRVINIGGGEEQTVEQLARRIVKWMNSTVAVVSAPARRRPTEISRSFCDNAEAALLLGWQPRTDLETGVRRTIEYVTASRQPIGEPILSGESRG